MFISRKIIIPAVLFLVPMLGMAEQVTEEWVARFNNDTDNTHNDPHDMAVDLSGNVYVTGDSRIWGLSTSADAVTIKYDSEGNLLWKDSYNSPDNLDDISSELILDSQGNVYVSGTTFTERTSTSTKSSALLIKYASNGSRLWVKRDNPTAFNYLLLSDQALDSQENVYVAVGLELGRLSNSTDYLIIKYSKVDGSVLWSRIYQTNRPNSFAFRPKITVDSADNVYLIGTNESTDTGGLLGGTMLSNDILTVKYDKDGNYKWHQIYNSENNGNVINIESAIAIDGNNNIFVGGATRGPAPEPNQYLTIKYSPEGELQWDIIEPNANGFIRDIFADDSNVYVTGNSHDTIKYTTDGNKEWQQRKILTNDDGSVSKARAVQIEVNDLGEVFTLSYDQFTITKYDENGNEIWSIKPEDIEVGGRRFVLDNNNIYVTGTGRTSSTTADYLTIKYAINRDGDEDGVDDASDSCPLEDSTGLDADHDGCIDSVSGLVDTLDTLVSEGTIAEEMSNSLRQKINRAIATAGRDNLCTAINQLESFKNQIEAQRGKKVSDETADLLISYSNNLISGFEADLGTGESCS